jgi:hypothetical protein
VPVRPCATTATRTAGWTRTSGSKWARGVWEIDEFDVLDGAALGKESDEEKHVCPLQLELIRRCVLLYTNPPPCSPT